MSTLFPGNCSAATNYARASDFPWTSITNDPLAAPLPIFKSIDNRLSNLEVNIAAAAGWPGTSTAYNWINTYNNTHHTGWVADTLDGRHKTYFENLAIPKPDEPQAAFGHAPYDCSTMRASGGQGYYGARKACFDGTYWYMNTTRVGGYCVRVGQQDSIWQSKLYAHNLTAVPAGGMGLLNVAGGSHYVHDVKYHDGFVYALCCHVKTPKVSNVRLLKLNRNDLSLVSQLKIAAMTAEGSLGVGADGFMYIGANRHRVQVACVYDLEAIPMSWAMTQMPKGNDYCESVWNDGQFTYLGLHNVSCAAKNGAAQLAHPLGAGIATYFYNPVSSSWHRQYAFHHTQMDRLYCGKHLAGPYSAYIAVNNQILTGTTSFNYIWQDRALIRGATNYGEGVRLRQSATYNKYDSLTHIRCWEKARNDRIVIGVGCQSTAGGVDEQMVHSLQWYPRMNITTGVAAKSFRLSHVAASGSFWTSGASHHQCRDLVFGGGTILAVFGHVGNMTAKSGIVKDAGWAN